MKIIEDDSLLNSNRNSLFTTIVNSVALVFGKDKSIAKKYKPKLKNNKSIGQELYELGKKYGTNST
ncbi:MAG: hypothetical protein ACRCZ9_09575 [Fusobacteriaceae bacterium]